MSEYAPCPECDAEDAEKVTFTWWGGLIGPALFTHVKCQECGTAYNGRTGRSNTTNIVLYSIVAFAIAIVVFGAMAIAFGMFMARR
jgi:hypothetical protein